MREANARLYDLALGRFLSPDPYVQMPDFTQNFNRYSYCLNNPLVYVDENGEFIDLALFLVGSAIVGGYFWGSQPDGSFDWGKAAAGAGATLLYTGATIASFYLPGATAGLHGALQGFATAGGQFGLTALTTASMNWMSTGKFAPNWTAAGISAIPGLIAGVAGGLDAKINGHANFWTGSRTEYVKSAGLSKALGYNVYNEIKGFYVGEFEGVSIYESKKLGTYAESKLHYSGGVTLPGLGSRIFVGQGVLSKNYDPNLLMHEFGHVLQSDIVGFNQFYSKIGVPSLWSAKFNPNHNGFWTETWSNYLSNNYFTMKYNALQLTLNWDTSRFPIGNLTKDYFERMFGLPYELNRIRRVIPLY